MALLPIFRVARSSRTDLSMIIARALKIGKIADGGMPSTYETMHWSHTSTRNLVGGFGSENYLAREPVVTLAPQNDKRVIVTVHGPRTGRYFAEFDELPVARIFVAKTQVIANRRRHIQAGALI